MRSAHADEYNHDEAAEGYDADVRNEADPIRAGYEATLDWVASMAGVHEKWRVLELGSGTGNLTQRLPACREIVCVDVSERMEEVARRKSVGGRNRRFVREDILAVFDSDIGSFDAVLSTYTIHHLTEPEKRRLFAEIWSKLNSGGRAVFGDLMLECARVREEKIKEYRGRGYPDVAAAIEEEFFWHLEESVAAMEEIGFEVETKRFSDLAYGVVVYKR